MARYYASIQGNRGEATRMGHASSGISGHVRGWDMGVRTEVFALGDRDNADVRLTGGSHGYKSSLPLATVREQEDGTLLVFFPLLSDTAYVRIDKDGSVTDRVLMQHGDEKVTA